VPSSLRNDPGHLNNDGSVAVAAKVKDFILAKGW
jgi:lysophospholipase L1-like esterase